MIYFPCGGLICHVSTAGFHNIVSLSCQFHPLKSFISLIFLSVTFSEPFPSLYFLNTSLKDTAGMGCWVISLWPLESRCAFLTGWKVILNLYLGRQIVFPVWSLESLKEALHPAVVPLWFVVGIIACVYVHFMPPFCVNSDSRDWKCGMRAYLVVANFAA